MFLARLTTAVDRLVQTYTATPYYRVGCGGCGRQRATAAEVWIKYGQWTDYTKPWATTRNVCSRACLRIVLPIEKGEET